MAFIATPVGIVIRCCVAGLAVIPHGFRGLKKELKRIKCLKCLYKQTLDIPSIMGAGLGEWLFNAFTKPKKALRIYLIFIEDQVMVRLKSFAKMGEAILKDFLG